VEITGQQHAGGDIVLAGGVAQAVDRVDLFLPLRDGRAASFA
jgi:hypothetical protein